MHGTEALLVALWIFLGALGLSILLSFVFPGLGRRARPPRYYDDNYQVKRDLERIRHLQDLDYNRRLGKRE